jgi:hypothetical protein
MFSVLMKMIYLVRLLGHQRRQIGADHLRLSLTNIMNIFRVLENVSPNKRLRAD